MRIGRASGSNIDTSRSVIGSPAIRSLICVATRSARSASCSSRAIAASLRCAPRPRARRRAVTREPPGFADRPRQQLTGLLGQREHLRFALPGAPPHRARDRPQPTPQRPAAIPHPPSIRADQRRSACAPHARASSPRPGSTPRRSDSAHRPPRPSSRSSPPARESASRAAPSRSHNRVSSSTTSPPSRRVSLRTVDSCGTRSPSAIRQNRRRCSESETSRTSVSYPQPVRCLDDHQPHIGLHRDRRTPMSSTRPPRQSAAIGSSSARSLNSTSNAAQILRQLPHLARQHLVPQRLDLPTRQPQHQQPPRSETSPFAGPILLIEPDRPPTISGASS